MCMYIYTLLEREERSIYAMSIPGCVIYIYILNQRGDIYILYLYTCIYGQHKKNATICEFQWKL